MKGSFTIVHGVILGSSMLYYLSFVAGVKRIFLIS